MAEKIQDLEVDYPHVCLLVVIIAAETICNKLAYYATCTWSAYFYRFSILCCMYSVVVSLQQLTYCTNSNAFYTTLQN